MQIMRGECGLREIVRWQDSSPGETIVRVYTVETRRKCGGSNKNSSSVAVWRMGVHSTGTLLEGKTEEI